MWKNFSSWFVESDDIKYLEKFSSFTCQQLFQRKIRQKPLTILWYFRAMQFIPSLHGLKWLWIPFKNLCPMTSLFVGCTFQFLFFYEMTSMLAHWVSFLSRYASIFFYFFLLNQTNIWRHREPVRSKFYLLFLHTIFL